MHTNKMKKLLSAKHQIKDSEWVRKSEKTKSKHLRICQWCARTKSSNKLQHRNFCQSCFIYFSPNKTRLKFDHDFKACWSFCFKLNLLNESNYSMPWVRCAIVFCTNIPKHGWGSLADAFTWAFILNDVKWVAVLLFPNFHPPNELWA